MTAIHPTAIVDPAAQLEPSVSVGPYCVVGPEVTLEGDVVLHSHVVVGGRTRVGEATQIFPFASIGLQPQDLKYHGEPSVLSIGARNVIREHVTMNPGTEGGGMQTIVGDDCLFMMASHVAHDCRVGNRVVMANNATLAGHVTVGDHAVIGGLAAIHQFVRIGRHAMIGGMSGVEADVIPFGSVMGERAALAGLNLIGMKRRDFNRETIHAMRSAFRDLFEGADGTLAERAEKASQAYAGHPDVAEMIDFIRADSKRSICI